MSENKHSFAHNVQKIATNIPDELHRVSALWGISQVIHEFSVAISSNQTADDISFDIAEILQFCRDEIRKIQSSQNCRMALIKAVTNHA